MWQIQSQLYITHLANLGNFDQILAKGADNAIDSNHIKEVLPCASLAGIGDRTILEDN